MTIPISKCLYHSKEKMGLEIKDIRDLIRARAGGFDAGYEEIPKYQIICLDCHARGPSKKSAEDATKEWNYLMAKAHLGGVEV